MALKIFRRDNLLIENTSPTVKNVLRVLFVTALLASVGSSGSLPPGARALAPATRMVVKDHKGACQLSVSDDWVTMAGFGIASDPTKKATAAIHTDQKNWKDFKEQIKRVYKATQVVEDDSSRYLFTYGTSGLHYDVARPFPGLTCIAQVDVNDDKAVGSLSGVAKQIIESVDRVH